MARHRQRQFLDAEAHCLYQSNFMIPMYVFHMEINITQTGQLKGGTHKWQFPSQNSNFFPSAFSRNSKRNNREYG